MKKGERQDKRDKTHTPGGRGRKRETRERRERERKKWSGRDQTCKWAQIRKDICRNYNVLYKLYLFNQNHKNNACLFKNLNQPLDKMRNI